ncbi:MAG: hypothetical protein Q7S74_05500, partial [Nanoarchaeota archaeon]|nr:hypothetical protein [Nanoarchaeota archaeon]
MNRIQFDSEGRMLSIDNVELDKPPQSKNQILESPSFQPLSITDSPTKGWSLYEDNKPLIPLKFSNGKTQ